MKHVIFIFVLIYVGSARADMYPKENPSTFIKYENDGKTIRLKKCSTQGSNLCEADLIGERAFGEAEVYNALVRISNDFNNSAGTIMTLGSLSGCALGSGVGVLIFGVGAIPACGIGAAAMDGVLLKFSPDNAHLYGAKNGAFSKKAIQFSGTTEQAITLLEKYLPRSF